MLPKLHFWARALVTGEPNSPPAVLGERGAAFWRELFSEMEFNSKETALVLEACRTLDRIEALADAIELDGLTVKGSVGQTVVHPAVSELRQQQAGLARLLGAIDFPEDLAADDLFRHRRAKAGASARWDRPASKSAVTRRVAAGG